MITVQRNPQPEAIPQSARHVLFVEGKDENALDPVILSELLPDPVEVKPLGPSYHISAAAEALHKHHPDYYFLVDRDHYDDAFVEKCWKEFPDPDTNNLLVWRRRELENYFLIPEYAGKSQFLNVTEQELRKTILDCCSRRLFLDAANQVIVAIREEQKMKWVELFTKANEFPTRKAALEKLLQVKEFAERKKAVSEQMTKKALSKRFETILNGLAGGKTALEFGCGRWLELLKGKEVLPTVVQKCFTVRDANDRALQGRDKVNEVAKDLVRKPLAEQPDDFQRLHQLIADRVKS